MLENFHTYQVVTKQKQEWMKQNHLQNGWESNFLLTLEQGQQIHWLQAALRETVSNNAANLLHYSLLL